MVAFYYTNESTMSECLWSDTKQEVFTVNDCSSTLGTIRKEEKECQHGWSTDEIAFFLLRTHSLFHSPPIELWHTLLLYFLPAAAFLFLSSHPPTSHPILLQIMSFDIHFPSDPFPHPFLCFLYLSLECWSHLALFLCLPAWCREPARSTGHRMSQQCVKKGR